MFITRLPISVKKVKGIGYLYFTRYDAVLRKKIEEYCGPENDKKAVEKAERLERKYLQDKLQDSARSIQHQIDELEARKSKRTP